MISPWLGGAAAVGILAGFWRYIQAFLLKIVSIFIASVKLDGDMPTAVIAYCNDKLKRFPLGNRMYYGYSDRVKPMRRTQRVGYENLGDRSSVFWWGRVPVFLGKGIPSGNKDSGGPGDGKELFLTYIRGTINIDQFLTNAIDYMNSKTANQSERTRFRVVRVAGNGSILGRKFSQGNDRAFQVDSPELASKPSSSEFYFLGDKRFLKWRPDELGMDVFAEDNSSAFKVLAFPPKVESLMDEMKKWKESERWYREKKIPWRRGWLLYGIPGTGKSSLVKALAYDLDLPVYSFDLSTMSNQELVEGWTKMKNNVPCIALMEDIDAIFNGRDNVLGEMGGGLTFDCLLNCIGGIDVNDGIFLIVTTNNVEMLDAALGTPRKDKEANGTMISTRPGRIDRALELGLLDERCRIKVASRILEDCPELIDKIVFDGDGDTPAQFQERCTQVALREYWDKHANRK